MLQIKPFDPIYLKEIVEIWNQTLIADPIDETRFMSLIVADENYQKELCLMVMDMEKPVGFMWAIKRKYPYLDRGTEPDRGYIGAMFVKSTHQRKGIGGKMIRNIEEKFAEMGAMEITIGAYSPNYLFPGVDIYAYKESLPFFMKLSYQGDAEAVSMHRHLMNYTIPHEILEKKKRLENEGYTFLPFEYEDSVELIDFIHEQFGAGWKYNIQNAIKRRNAKNTLIVCRNKSGDIVGYVQRMIDGMPDRFGPFGVHEDLRSSGLGSILFHLILSDMSKIGIHHVYFLWTGGKAQKFYERQGMVPYRTYRLLKKRLELK